MPRRVIERAGAALQAKTRHPKNRDQADSRRRSAAEETRPLHRDPDEGSYNPQPHNEVTTVWPWFVCAADRRQAAYPGLVDNDPTDRVPVPTNWRSLPDEDRS